MKLRAARLADVGALLAIEREAFTTDLLSARKLRHLLTRGNCELVVAEEGRRLAGYALVLFRRRATTARLYGIAVAADSRGRGVGGSLLREAERRARTRGALRMRLESSPRNIAVNLYRKEGYRLISHLGPYYADGTWADRYEKPFAEPPRQRASGDSSPAARRLSGQIARPRGPGLSGPGRGANHVERRLREPRAVERDESMKKKAKKPAAKAKKAAPKKAAPKAKKPAPKKAAPKKAAPAKKAAAPAPAKKAAAPAPVVHPEEE